MRLEPEQVRTDLIVQLERSASPLVVLRRDQPMVELFVLGARGLERLRQRVESIGDGGELLCLRSRQPHPVIVMLEVGEAAGNPGERIEHPPEENIENADDGNVHAERNGPERDRVAPHFGDLVVRLGYDLDRADARPVDDDRHVTACDRGGDQRREPRRHTIIPSGCSSRRMWPEGRAAGVLHHDPHVAHEPQLRVEVGEEFFRWHLLLHEGDRLAHEQLGELHRRGDLDPRRRARLEDGHGARHQSRDQIDHNENDEELRAHRTAMPQRVRQGARRRPRQRLKQWHPTFGSGADERPPRGGRSAG